MSERDLAITFAGGGNRSFYELGLMNGWRSHLLPRTGCFATCSAGACVAILSLTGREEEVGQYWKELCREVKKNFIWRRLLSGKRPTPHEPLYREMLLYALSAGGFERVRSQPFPVLVLTTAPPRGVPIFVALTLALAAYKLEKRVRKGLIHPTFGRRAGFKAQVFDARACETPDELADLIISSSATPPFTAVGRFAGRRLLDGGIIDNVPAFLADNIPGIKRNLVMLSRPYPPGVIGRQGSRLYVAPRTTLPIERWDFTRPDLLESTVAIGERDAREQESMLTSFLS
ncbi:MAG TPA: patatin-like phospholipase family protein [Pyrinomonadaceae bacterium]|nr:patatin-like phospholipase family protein [Pyrinomonadaceae bacterium]